MSKKSEQVKAGYATLDFSERQEVLRWIQNYENSSISQRSILLAESERLSNKQSVGPRNENACACCGR